MDQERVDTLVALGARIVEEAKRRGAEVAEALVRDSIELSAKVRLERPELIEEAGSHAIGLRVQKEGRSAVTYTSDPSPPGIEALIGDALELAALSEPDPLSAPPDPSLLAKAWPELDLFDPKSIEIDARQATERAIRAEAAALSLDPRVANSEGATFQRVISAVALVTSGGFGGGYRGTHHTIDVSPVADDEGGKKRQAHHWDSRRFSFDLMPEEEVGRRAAQKTLEKLGAKKVPTAEVPVVFDPDAGRALLSLFFSCVSGYSIYQRSSYLLDKEGQAIASPLVTIADDPLLPRGPASRPFDGEGLASRKNVVVDRGVLKTYLLDTYSGRKLDRPSTGSAARSTGTRPSVAPTNFQLLAGSTPPEEIIESVDRGLYVTSMMGFGFNPVTGDFSRGAEGFWIEKGARAFPVGEITIGLNFLELWKRIDAVGDDLDLKSSFACPTFRVSKMTIAGT